MRYIMSIISPGGRKDSLNLYSRVAFPGMLKVFTIFRKKRLKQRKHPVNKTLLIRMLNN